MVRSPHAPQAHGDFGDAHGLLPDWTSPCSAEQARGAQPSLPPTAGSERLRAARRHGIWGVDGPTKPCNALLLLVFVVTTGLAGLVDALLPIAMPPLVGEELAQRQTRRQALRWQDGSLARWIEEDRHLRSRVRHHLLPPYALLLYQTVGQVRGELLLGKDGWLFLRQRAIPRPDDDASLLEQAATTLWRLQGATRLAGHRLVTVPLPRKAGLAENKLPRGVDARPDLDRRLVAVLRRHGVDTVDVLPALQRLPKTWDEAPYFRADSHLTQSAMVEVAEGIARHLEARVPPAERRSELRYLGLQAAEFDLLRYVGIRWTPLTQRFAGLEGRHAFQVLAADGRPMPRQRPPWTAAQNPTTTQTPPPTLLVGTSFSTVGQLSTLLSHAIDLPVLDAAKAGESPFLLLERVLYGPWRLHTAHTIVLELPNHLLFDQDGLAAAKALIEAASPPTGAPPQRLSASPYREHAEADVR